ncbi:SAM-dependent methyltransferase [Bacillus ectoiniformans]|uniref:methyltransferase n=1 Tax=Bacillus ectoiniformans TaxID=1494429 RepID=UPI001958B7EC|nr:methyltransferase [Bacillus ectoiniformans]MBM7649782.1 SAM-dependent methyltransferase [Bacillus ectoiniformans]
MKEQHYDDLLHIKTRADQKTLNHSLHYHPYEPTPYHALEELFNQYELKSTDQFVDYGCGKGRLNFFVHHLFHCRVTGIEMNDTFYREAIANQKSYSAKSSPRHSEIQFYHCLAEDYPINPIDNRFYFFNPFTIQIFMKIIYSILHSAETYPRDIELIIYYGSDDYIYFMNNHTSFELEKEIEVPGWHEKNSYERFLIYRLT